MKTRLSILMLVQVCALLTPKSVGAQDQMQESRNTQKNVNFGLETGISYIKAYGHQTDLTQETVFHSKYKKYEIAVGISTSEFFQLGYNAYNILGPVFSARYHLTNEKRLSHFVFGANFQTRRYINPIGDYPLRYNSDISGVHTNPILYKARSSNLHLSVGYEVIFLRRISLIARTGIGIAKHDLRLTQFGIDNGYTDPVIWELIPYFNFALRVYIVKL